MTIKPKVYECFSIAKKDEEKGKKHKGLLFVGRDDKKAEEYVQNEEIMFSEKNFEVPKESL